MPLLADPFSAVAPFATGASRLSQGMHRDMPIDVKETEKAIEINADIPGVTKEDINLDMENDVLVLSVDKSEKKDEEKEEKGVTWHHTERSHIFMKRSLRMPETADMEKASAAYNNGVLSVTIPKKDIKSAKKKLTIA
eukprot:jgi/Ulvmu1/9115/UM005_0210.1